jgi:hypothetical protein
MFGEKGDVVLDAFGALGAADVGARLSELAETPDPFLDIPFHVISSQLCHVGSHRFLR